MKCHSSLLVAFSFIAWIPPAFAQLDPFGPARPTIPVIRFDRSTVEGVLSYAFCIDPAVQAHLNLTNEQRAKLKAIPDDVLAKHAKAIADYEAELKAKDVNDANATKTREDEIEVKLEELLGKYVSVEQRHRLAQIELQSRLADAFTDETVIKALSLKPEQVAAAKAATNKLLNDPPPTLRKQSEAKQKAYDDLVKSFTEQQKKAWDELIGKRSGSVDLTSRDRFSLRQNSFVSPRLQFWFDAANPILTANSALWTDELKLPPDRVTALLREIRRLRTDNRPRLSEQTSRLKLPTELMSGVSKETNSRVNEVLTEAQQKRINQVQSQLMGYRVFNNPHLLDELKFTAQQEAVLSRSIPEMIEKAVKITDPSRTLLNARGATTFSGYDPIINYDVLMAILTVLDDRQKAVIDQLWGPLLKRDDWRRLHTLSLGNPFIPERIPLTYNVDWSPAKAWNMRATNSLRTGKHSEGRIAYEQSLALNPKQNDVQLKLAMLLAASPIDEVRDGKAAMKLALELCEGDGRKAPANLELLAATQAENGQFDEAVKTQNEAIAILKAMPLPKLERFPTRDAERPTVQSQLLTSEARLNQYRQKKPYRMEMRNR